MSLRDRLKSKKESKAAAQRGEYIISIAKVSNAVNKVKNPADLGNIVKEFSKFLNTLEAQNARIVFSGDFDLGQRTLLNCILGGFLEDGSSKMNKETSVDETEENNTEKNESKISKRRKAIRERLAAKAETESEDE